MEISQSSIIRTLPGTRQGASEDRAVSQRFLNSVSKLKALRSPVARAPSDSVVSSGPF